MDSLGIPGVLVRVQPGEKKKSYIRLNRESDYKEWLTITGERTC